MLYGFSRGSTAASLAIGDRPNKEWSEQARGLFPEESAEIQKAFLGPGIFDYSKTLPESREFKNMSVYCSSQPSPEKAWEQQGGARSIRSGCVPCFLFYNSSDDAEYGRQMDNLIELLKTTGSEYELLKDYGIGHSVPQQLSDLKRMYEFLVRR